MSEGKLNEEYHLAKVVNAQTNPNATQRIGWSNINNALTKTTKTYATSYFTKERYIKKYNEKKKKDKKGKEVVEKIPVYDYRYNHPWTITAHQFELKIPAIRRVEQITFRVWMKVEKGVTVKQPRARFCIYGDAFSKHYETTTKSVTGWHNGLYYEYPSKNMSTNWVRYEYTMDAKNINLGDFSYKDYNDAITGIDLIFNDPDIKDDIKTQTGTVKKQIHLACVEMYIKYYTPTYKVTFTDNLSKDKYTYIKFDVLKNVELANESLIKSNAVTDVDAFQRRVSVNEIFRIKAHFHKTIDKSSTQDLKVTMPDGMEIIDVTPTKSTYNANTKTWTVKCSEEGQTLAFTLKSHKSGLNKITISNSKVSTTYKIDIVRGAFDGYENVVISTNQDKPHKNHKLCLGIDIDAHTEGADVTVEDDYQFLHYDISFTKAISGGEWSVHDDYKRYATIVASSSTGVLLKVPNRKFHVLLNYCFYPSETGKYCTTVTSREMHGDTNTMCFNVVSPYKYHLTSKLENSTNTDWYYPIKSDIVNIHNHRVLTGVDVETTSIPSVADARDGHMVQSKSTFVMHNQDELDYIGCVPLEHLHFDPKSTYKDTLLNNTYKNKKYMGKKLASDEDITLNVRLHPKQVTTIQGLIDMDKPIPINANHKCFEGDALNHRGWAEIYSIKAEETNPHWYKCDIDVKYLTHNLNTRFKIDKGIKVANYKKPQLLAETFTSGSKLDTDNYFYVDTDGTYSYSTDTEMIIDYRDEEGNTVIDIGDETTLTYTDDEGEEQTLTGINKIVAYLEDEGYVVVTPTLNQPIQVLEVIEVPDNQRNMFSIDEGQHIKVRTTEPLANQSIVTFEWLSTLLTEDNENQISRIIRLIDKRNNDVIFEYENTDIQVDDDEVTCETIARIKTPTGWETQIGSDVDMRINYPLGYDDDTEYDLETTSSELLYGSTVVMSLNGKKLSLIDEGFNGLEFQLPLDEDDEEIDLVSDTYYWETEWVNKNNDGESEDVVCYFDLTVASTVLTSQYADKYDKLYVSPFPVKDKDLVFTREAEEGTVYYFEDDGEEFSYIINPYYQYMNGTDLVTSDGISIFNLNYGYEVVYIQNGLVRLGFNRLNGKLYLGKYDLVTREYINTHRFHLKKYDDININSISDDKIEIQASDSIFTIWRGHPYIMVKHNTESIWIDSNFNRVWAEQVGNDVTEYPSNWYLLNDSNLLPSEVGGEKTIKASAITVDDSQVPTKGTSNLSWVTPLPSDMYVGVEYTYTIQGTAPVPKYSIPLSPYHGTLGYSNASVSVNNAIPYELQLYFDKNIIQLNEEDGVHARVLDYGGNGINGRTVYFFEAYEPELELKGNKSIIQTGDSVDLSTYLIDTQDGSRVREEGRTIHYYDKRYIVPPLNGTDSIVKWSNRSNYTANGVFTSHGSYLGDGWSNENNWKISFDYKYSQGDASYSTFYIGLMPICSAEINPFTDAKVTNYAIDTWEGGYSFSGLGRNGWISSPETTPSTSIQNNWTHMEITKLSDTRLKIVINDTYEWIGEFPNLVNLDTLYIGSRDNPSNRDTGAYIQFKNIIIKEK